MAAQLVADGSVPGGAADKDATHDRFTPEMNPVHKWSRPDNVDVERATASAKVGDVSQHLVAHGTP